MSLFPVKTQTLTYSIIILNIYFPLLSKQAGAEPKSICMENKAAERDSNNQTYSLAVFVKNAYCAFLQKRAPTFTFQVKLSATRKAIRNAAGEEKHERSKGKNRRAWLSSGGGGAWGVSERATAILLIHSTPERNRGRVSFLQTAYSTGQHSQLFSRPTCPHN